MKKHKEDIKNILHWSQKAVTFSEPGKPITTESKILAAGSTVIEFA